MFTSHFRCVSIGIAAHNKPRKSMQLEVTPIEMVDYIDGEITAQQEDESVEGVNGSDEPFTVEVSTATSVEATWLQYGSNRRTPPDVRRGERIMLFQYGDSDVYYWVSMGMDDVLRRLETVIHQYSNTRDESVRELTYDNTYSVEVSTHDKHLTIHTANNDGEPFEYTMQLDTKRGIFTLTDHDGNYVELVSGERKWTMINKDKSRLELNKKKAFLHTPDLIDMKTKHVNVECETMYTNATKSWTLETPKYDANVTTSWLTTTPQATMDNGGTSGITTIKGLTNVQEYLRADKMFGAGGVAVLGAGFILTQPPTISAGSPPSAPSSGNMSASESGGITSKLTMSFEQGAGVSVSGGGTYSHNGTDIGETHAHSGVTSGGSNTGSVA